MTSRDTEPHVGSSPEAIWLSGFAVVTARLPGRLGWAAVSRLPCGCTSYVAPDGDMDAIHEIVFRSGGGDEFWIDNIQPVDPT